LSVSKEERDAMTDEQKKAIPYVGNARAMTSAPQPAKEYGSVSFTPQGVSPSANKDVDDLPFD